MTEQEWLNIGLQNGLIDSLEFAKMTFKEAYRDWFASKCKINKPSTVDRIEVTFNRYFLGNPFIESYTSNIGEKDIVNFLTAIVVREGQISHRNLERIIQILRGVLQYVKDIGLRGSRLYDWDAVKRNIPIQHISHDAKVQLAPSKSVVNHILQSVVCENVYPLKRSTSLLLCLNFYLGLRIGELASLQFSDFDINNKVVRIHVSDSKYYERDENGNRTKLVYATGDTKTVNSIRTIPLLPEAIYIYKLIEEHHRICHYESVYLCYDGADVIRIRSLDRTLRRLCQLLCTSTYNSHLIRKTFATTLHHANVPSRVIADLMGHSEIGTTERNYILTFEDANAQYYDYMRLGLNYN